MKFSLRYLFGPVLLWALAHSALAQQQPVLAVKITDLDVQTGPGFVRSIDVTSGGSGYLVPPDVFIDGGQGFGAFATAVLNNGSVVKIVMVNTGLNYTSPPRVRIVSESGIGVGAAGIARIAFPTKHVSMPNEASGVYGNFVNITALAIGTNPAPGFIYNFFVNGVNVGTSINNIGSAAIPGAIAWTPPAPGSYFFHVTATDGGIVATSLPVRYFATGAVVTSPQSPTLVPAGSSVVLKGDATTSQGFVRQIEFFVDGESKGVDTTAPYSVIYTPPSTLREHTVTVRATDNNGGILDSTEDVIMVVVPAIGSIPLVSIASPATNSALRIPDYTVSGAAAIPMSVVANDSDGLLTKIELYIDGVLVSTDQQFPYSYNWQPQAIGNYRIVALAFDDKNNVVATDPSIVTISAPPTVTITRPTNNAALPAGAPVIVNANASDSDGSVASVQFFADNQLIGEDSSAPYSVTWTPENKSDTTTAVLTALATDNFGITTLSSTVNITVTGSGGGPGPGNTIGQPPTVALTNPANNARLVVNQPVILTANANDVDGNVLSVQFFANGQSLGTDGSFPYTVTWTPVSLGNYAIVAKSIDNDGNATSATASVTVVANSAGLPEVVLLSPFNGSKGTVGGVIALAASAIDSDGLVESVEFFVNGLSVGRTTGFPYVVGWIPTTAGVYSVTAAATDNGGNRVVTSVAAITVAAPVGNIPLTGLSFNDPGLNADDTSDSGLNPVPVSYGSKLLIGALAVDDDGTIASVEFYMNGRLLAKDTTAPYYVIAPLDTLQDAILFAVVTDSSGNVVYALPKVIDTLPSTNAANLTVTLSSPTNGGSYSVGSQIVFVASHNAGNQPPPRIDFYVNGQPFHTVVGEPFNYQVGLSQPGIYDIHAVVRAGTATSVSAPVRITVVPGTAPTVAITAPTNGSTVRLGGSVTVRATASDPDGTIESVQFYVNGTLQGGPDFDSPYSITFTPPAEGIYRFKALATDSSDISAISNEIVVMVTGTTAASSEAVYTGNYFAGAEIGKISLVNTGGKTAVAIAHSTTGAPKTYFYQGLTVDVSNGFTLTNPSGATVISGRFSDTGATGNFDGTRATFISPVTFGGASGAVPAGLYSGNIGSKLASNMVGILGNDGTLFVYVADGTATDAGSGVITSTGAFNFTLASGARIIGNVDSVTRFMVATITGGPVTGTILAASATGGGFSDGALRNLSTRGQVGTGDRALVAGFVVAGTTPKRVLIRGIGPTLGSFGMSGVLANPELTLFRGTSVVERNDNWGGGAEIASTSARVGAFALPASSLDAVILPLLAPGTYTVQVSGVSGGTGLALVEIYDVDAADPFTAQKVMNISTRGEVGTGDRLLLAGFVISGSSPKRVLVRAVGPTLSTFGVTGTLADPILRIAQGTLLIRENDNWETGNNVPLLLETTARSGAFALPTGSKDAVILLTLPPGTYTASVQGAGNTTGVAIVEVYEVP